MLAIDTDGSWYLEQFRGRSIYLISSEGCHPAGNAGPSRSDFASHTSQPVYSKQRLPSAATRVLMETGLDGITNAALQTKTPVVRLRYRLRR